VPVFVDTNVLVYAQDATEEQKQPLAREWLERLWRSRDGRVSYQVLQEYYVIVTAKLRPGMPVEEARGSVEDLVAWRPVVIDMPVMRAAWASQDRFGLSFWDALIIAAARAAECDMLLTEDLQEGIDLAGLRIVNPFTSDPDSVLR
jgi:predicted nucleic acid-binding protein